MKIYLIYIEGYYEYFIKWMKIKTDSMFIAFEEQSLDANEIIVTQYEDHSGGITSNLSPFQKIVFTIVNTIGIGLNNLASLENDPVNTPTEDTTNGSGTTIGMIEILAIGPEKTRLQFTENDPKFEEIAKVVLSEISKIWKVTHPSKKGGRPRDTANEWAYDQVNNHDRDRKQVFDDWKIMKGDTAINFLADPRDSFRKAIKPKRK